MNTSHKIKLSISEILQESWEKVYGIKWQVCKVYIIYPILIYLASLLALLIIAILFAQKLAVIVYLLVIPILISVIFCSQISAIAIGLRHTTNRDATSEIAALDCLPILSRLILLLILYVFIIIILYFSSFIIVYLVNEYLPSFIPIELLFLFVYFLASVFYLQLTFFAIPLLIEKHVSVLFALKKSFLMLTQNFMTVVLCGLIMYVILFISAIPWGIGLIWTIPMSVNMIGIIFRETENFKPNSEEENSPPKRMGRLNRGALVQKQNNQPL